MKDKDKERRLGSSTLITFHRGQPVQIRQTDTRKWKDYTMRDTIKARTTKRIGQTIYAEFLNYEIRYTYQSELFDKRFGRY